MIEEKSNQEIRNKRIEPQWDIIDKALTMLIAIIAVSLFTPIIAYIVSGDVALVAILTEKEIDNQLWNVLLILVGAITAKKIK